MRFSVVIPTRNRAATLRQTLAAVTAQDYPHYEVIVVDDGSTDDTAGMVAAEFPNVRLIRQSNRGPAAARNRAIRESSGEVVAFTDDDCVPPGDWLTRLAEGYSRYPKVAGAGGRLEPPPDVLRHSVLARYERFVAQSMYRVGDEDVLGGFECPAGGTNNMSYRRAVLESAGGFDETFPYAAGEDADLKWRVCQAGAQILYIPITVEHLQAYTWQSFRRQAFRRGQGRARFEAKHGPRPSRGRSLLRLARRLARFPLDLVSADRRPYAIVRAVEAWQNCRGEWDAIGSLHIWTSSM